MTNPRWRPGKGLVGVAVERANLVWADWADFFRNGHAGGPAGWRRRDARQRYGLSWGELQATEDYQGIAAFPVFQLARDGKVVGGVAVDGPYRGGLRPALGAARACHPGAARRGTDRLVARVITVCQTIRGR
jgi:hypothetical protein